MKASVESNVEQQPQGLFNWFAMFAPSERVVCFLHAVSQYQKWKSSFWSHRHSQLVSFLGMTELIHFPRENHAMYQTREISTTNQLSNQLARRRLYCFNIEQSSYACTWVGAVHQSIFFVNRQCSIEKEISNLCTETFFFFWILGMNARQRVNFQWFLCYSRLAIV